MFGGLFDKKETENEIKILTGPLENFQTETIASNSDTILLSSYDELDGFKFLKLRIIGPLNVRTQNGGEVKFIGESGSIICEIDNNEISTYYEKKVKIGITEVDIDLEEDLIQMIENEVISKVEILIKKHHVSLDMVKQDLLKTSLTVVDEEE